VALPSPKEKEELFRGGAKPINKLVEKKSGTALENTKYSIKEGAGGTGKKTCAVARGT